MNTVFVLFGIFIFGILIAVHELGHFMAAKACGVKVEEFSIGMGPVIYSKKKGETLYSLRAIPMGGYCAMAGEDEESEDPRAFTSQKPWKRAIILVAGSFMNILAGFLMVLCIFSEAEAFRAPVIVDFMEGCPYEAADALLEGDRIHSIDGKRVRLYSDVSELLNAGDGVYDIVVIREGKGKVELKDFELTRLEYPGQTGKMYGFYFGVDEPSFANKIKYSWYNTLDFGSMVWDGLRQLVRGEIGMTDMSGPVGVVDMMTETGSQAVNTWEGLKNIFYLGAFIAVNLGIMNMLPIPALDGGRIFLLLVTWVVETVTRKKLNPKYEGYIHAAGMVLLLALMAFVMFNDILRIVKR